MGSAGRKIAFGFGVELFGLGGAALVPDFPDLVACLLMIGGLALILWGGVSSIPTAEIGFPFIRVSLTKASSAFYNGVPSSTRDVIAKMNGNDGMLDYARHAFLIAAKNGVITLHGRRSGGIPPEPIRDDLATLHPKGNEGLGYVLDEEPRWVDVTVAWSDIARVRKTYVRELKAKIR